VNLSFRLLPANAPGISVLMRGIVVLWTASDATESRHNPEAVNRRLRVRLSFPKVG
jgi:hypothetical protein